MNDGRSPPLEKSLTRIFVTGDSEQYYTVDITGFRNAAFIKELIFSKVRTRYNPALANELNRSLASDRGRGTIAILYLSYGNRFICSWWFRP